MGEKRGATSRAALKVARSKRHRRCPFGVSCYRSGRGVAVLPTRFATADEASAKARDVVGVGDIDHAVIWENQRGRRYAIDIVTPCCPDCGFAWSLCCCGDDHG